MNWTREHDAWIARECDGMKAQKERGMPERLWKWKGTNYYGYCPSYSTDIAACIRAAEAWRKRGEGRTVKIEWEGPDVKAGLGDRVGGWHQWFSPCDRAALALAWALYRATGGPV